MQSIEMWISGAYQMCAIPIQRNENWENGKQQQDDKKKRGPKTSPLIGIMKGSIKMEESRKKTYRSTFRALKVTNKN